MMQVFGYSPHNGIAANWQNVNSRFLDFSIPSHRLRKVLKDNKAIFQR